MTRARALPFPRWLKQGRNRGIDLGGGRTVPPEELLESHFRRLSAGERRPTASQEVQVQLGPNVRAAIRVVAPSLAPLAEIAEELANKLGTVQPTPQFRSELHHALEEAHRVRAQERAAAGAVVKGAPGWLWYVAAGGFVVLLTALVLLFRPRRAS